jgi:hypothetical protein
VRILLIERARGASHLTGPSGRQGFCPPFPCRPCFFMGAPQSHVPALARTASSASGPWWAATRALSGRVATRIGQEPHEIPTKQGFRPTSMLPTDRELLRGIPSSAPKGRKEIAGGVGPRNARRGTRSPEGAKERPEFRGDSQVSVAPSGLFVSGPFSGGSRPRLSPFAPSGLGRE